MIKFLAFFSLLTILSFQVTASDYQDVDNGLVTIEAVLNQELEESGLKACSAPMPECYYWERRGDVGIQHYRCCYECRYGDWQAICQAI